MRHLPSPSADCYLAVNYGLKATQHSTQSPFPSPQIGFEPGSPLARPRSLKNTRSTILSSAHVKLSTPHKVTLELRSAAEKCPPLIIFRALKPKVSAAELDAWPCDADDERLQFPFVPADPRVIKKIDDKFRQPDRRPFHPTLHNQLVEDLTALYDGSHPPVTKRAASKICLDFRDARTATHFCSKWNEVDQKVGKVGGPDIMENGLDRATARPRRGTSSLASAIMSWSRMSRSSRIADERTENGKPRRKSSRFTAHA